MALSIALASMKSEGLHKGSEIKYVVAEFALD